MYVCTTFMEKYLKMICYKNKLGDILLMSLHP